MNKSQDRFDGVSIFVKVVETKNFTLAANELGKSTSFISKEINKLESRLAIKLLNRTTRTLGLTDEGRIYYLRCKQIVADIEDTHQVIVNLHEQARGVLKIAAPVTFGLHFLKQRLPLFIDAYPEVQLEVDFCDNPVDIVSDGYDAVFNVGELKDSSLVARHVLSYEEVIVASPEYLAKNARPMHPKDLVTHSCVSFSLDRLQGHWDFIEASGQKTSVSITPKLSCNNMELEKYLALSGVGIARLPNYHCINEIDSGELVPIMNEYAGGKVAINIVYPHRQFLSTKVKVFIDFIKSSFGDEI